MAIVNAANKQLASGGGVCGAIFNKAGMTELQQECNQFPADKEGVRCQVGKAVRTSGHKLAPPIKHIIHTVGPDCRQVTEKKMQDTLLKAAYISALQVADRYTIKSIAFPCISTGIYGFDLSRACPIALDAVKTYCEKPTTGIKEVQLVTYDSLAFSLYKNQLQSS